MFIDEEKATHELFEEYVYNSSLADEIKLIPVFPESKLDDMCEKILKSDIDAVVSDFMLNEIKEDIVYAIEYNGVDLVESILEIKKGFPCFVMTSYDTDAIDASEDVNKVYAKEILYGDDTAKGNDPFLIRLKSQCDKYRKKISEAQEELTSLIENSNERKLSIKEEERLIELDDFLEESIDARNPIPHELKKISNQDNLVKLLSKVDEFIEEFKKNDQI
ncbi:hypothetical protein [Psychrobacter sp. TB55-MNA-CIBAN-0194]|uniref:hypothetical protein n=1 Tax=Psychrobacter sp. TB55-MNA-CIBAN-0194 TaxID=3140445 RepID=UPI00332089A0